MSSVELARRVEALEGPDRATDGLIWAHLKRDEPFIVGHKPGRFPQKPIYGIAADVMRAFPNKDGADYICAPAYTASLDAAMTLVPDQAWWWVEAQPLVHGKFLAGCGDERVSGGATPALALTAAALRALIATAVEEGGD